MYQNALMLIINNNNLATSPMNGNRTAYELLGDITAAQALTAFSRQLRTFLFRLSYPDFAKIPVRCSAFFAIATKLTYRRHIHRLRQ
jgi:hypothetical protein